MPAVRLALGLMLASALAATGCARRGPEAKAPAPARKVEFTPVPAMEAIHAANPHDHRGKPLCQRCHEQGEERLGLDPIALCAQCHEPAHMRHPFDVPQPDPPADLPFGPGARIVCHTCHDPHDVKTHRGGLRLEYGALCARCHVRHGKRPAPPNP